MSLSSFEPKQFVKKCKVQDYIKKVNKLWLEHTIRILCNNTIWQINKQNVLQIEVHIMKIISKQTKKVIAQGSWHLTYYSLVNTWIIILL